MVPNPSSVLAASERPCPLRIEPGADEHVRRIRRRQLPPPQALAQLGTVLCVYRSRGGGELAGWSQATCAYAGASLDSDGMRECIAFHDASGHCCWKLYLLPDSDFLAWERLVATLPAQPAEEPASSIGERLFQRLVMRARHGEWRASVLRLHALRTGAAPEAVLAAALASVSALGASTARAIARSLGADPGSLSDACCCLREAAATTHRDLDACDEACPVVRMPRR